MRKHIPLYLLCIFSLVFGERASAQLIPANDNTSAPYLGVFGGPLSIAGGNWDDNFANWLNRSSIWAEGFNGGTGTTWTWTDGIEGNIGYISAGKRWVATHPGSMYVLSVGMLPGTISSGGVGVPQSGHTLAKGANGDYDAHWVTLAQRLATYGPPSENIVIRLGWEFNGFWYPWSIKEGVAGREPADFAAYFARIVTVMKAVPGCSNLKFCWNGATAWSSYYPGEAYPKDIPESTVFPVHPAYPGNSYVDYVGVDMYDRSTKYTGTPPYSQAMRDAAWNQQLSTYNSHLATWKNIATSPAWANGKPLCFPEWGLSTKTGADGDDVGGQDNPEFIRHMFEFIHDPVNNVAWHVYFDTNSASNHTISTLPWGTLSKPLAAAKFQQLFGVPLPNKKDFGTTGLAGAVDGISVKGAGAGYLAATSDNFFFSSRPAPSDDMFVVKLTSTSLPAGQSGVMVRPNNTAANAAYAAVFLSNGKCQFQARSSTGAAAVPYGIALPMAAPTPASPVWLKLLRKGDFVGAFVSKDGVNWDRVGGISVPLGSSAQIGLAVSSGNTTALNATGFNELNGAIGVNWLENADFYYGLQEQVRNSVIVDNESTVPGEVVKTGTWTPSSSILQFFGGSYLTGPASGSASVKFTPTLPAAGQYSVFLRWPQDPGFTYDASLTIVSSDGTFDYTANQSVGKNMWHYAGTYQFAQGTEGSVTIGRSNTYGTTVADAVMFVPAPQNLIVDNTQAELGGTWTASTGATGQYYGSNYLKDDGTGKGGKTARFRPAIPETGYYEVFSTWSVLSGVTYASNVPYTVTHANGTTPWTGNHQANGGKWNSLGIYKFNAGTTGNVLISNAGTANGAQVLVDAVKFVYVPPTEIIVDNQQASLTEGTGIWTPSSGAEGQFYGADYLKDDNAGKGTKKARFTPNLPSAGTYKIYAKWSVMVGTAYSNSVSYEISHSGGTTPPLLINQRVNGGLWNLIGTYTFPAGSSPATGSVLITNTGSGNVIVDAVKFVKE